MDDPVVVAYPVIFGNVIGFNDFRRTETQIAVKPDPKIIPDITNVYLEIVYWRSITHLCFKGKGIIC
jgi:hypothetical protein